MCGVDGKGYVITILTEDLQGCSMRSLCRRITNDDSTCPSISHRHACRHNRRVLLEVAGECGRYVSLVHSCVAAPRNDQERVMRSSTAERPVSFGHQARIGTAARLIELFGVDNGRGTVLLFGMPHECSARGCFVDEKLDVFRTKNGKRLIDHRLDDLGGSSRWKPLHSLKPHSLRRLPLTLTDMGKENTKKDH